MAQSILFWGFALSGFIMAVLGLWLVGIASLESIATRLNEDHRLTHPIAVVEGFMVETIEEYFSTSMAVALSVSVVAVSSSTLVGIITFVLSLVF